MVPARPEYTQALPADRVDPPADTRRPDGRRLGGLSDRMGHLRHRDDRPWSDPALQNVRVPGPAHGHAVVDPSLLCRRIPLRISFTP